MNAFYPAVAGVKFIPLGGTKDRSADAILEHKDVSTVAELALRSI